MSRAKKVKDYLLHRLFGMGKKIKRDKNLNMAFIWNIMDNILLEFTLYTGGRKFELM